MARFVLEFPTPPALLLSLWEVFQVHQLQLVSPSSSSSIAFSVLWQGLSIRLFLWFSFCGRPGRQSSLFSRFSFFFLLTITKSGLLAGIRYLFVSQNPRELCGSHSLFRFLYIPSSRMIRIQFFAQFPMDYLFHPLLFSLVFFFCASQLHSLIMWLIVSSLSPHNLHLL